MMEREGNRWRLMEEEKKREDDKLLSIESSYWKQTLAVLHITLFHSSMIKISQERRSYTK